MAKQVKDCAGKDSFQRMNYLYQASDLIAKVSMKNTKKESKDCLDFVSNYYSNLVINVAKKGVLRIDYNIKRTICKGCHSLLIPGESARIRLRQKPSPHVRWTCLKCHIFRTFNTKRDYKLWYDHPQAVTQVLEYKNETENDEPSPSS